MLGNDIIVVDEVLKFIQMVVKYENDFEISEFYRLWIFEKVENFMEFLKIFKKIDFFEVEKEERRDEKREGSCSTSYSSGNQVDGLPLVAMKSNTKTPRKRKSREPRTQMHLTTENMFLSVMALGSVLVIHRFVVDYLLKFI